MSFRSYINPIYRLSFMHSSFWSWTSSFIWTFEASPYHHYRSSSGHLHWSPLGRLYIGPPSRLYHHLYRHPLIRAYMRPSSYPYRYPCSHHKWRPSGQHYTILLSVFISIFWVVPIDDPQIVYKYILAVVQTSLWLSIRIFFWAFFMSYI